MRVLIADGDEAFLEVAQRYLSDRGHEVNIATTGIETIARLRRDLPEVVVLDQELLWGGSDGVRAVMRQVPEWSEIPVILTSSGSMAEESCAVASPPVVGRLRKPYRLKDLLDHLQERGPKGTPSPLSVNVQGRGA